MGCSLPTSTGFLAGFLSPQVCCAATFTRQFDWEPKVELRQWAFETRLAELMGRPKENIGLLKHVLCPLFVDCYSHNYQYHCYYHDYSYSFHLFLMVTCFETMQFWIDIVRPSGMSPNFFGGMAKTREAWQPDRGFDTRVWHSSRP